MADQENERRKRREHRKWGKSWNHSDQIWILFWANKWYAMKTNKWWNLRGNIICFDGGRAKADSVVIRRVSEDKISHFCLRRLGSTDKFRIALAVYRISEHFLIPSTPSATVSPNNDWWRRKRQLETDRRRCEVSKESGNCHKHEAVNQIKHVTNHCPLRPTGPPAPRSLSLFLCTYWSNNYLISFPENRRGRGKWGTYCWQTKRKLQLIKQKRSTIERERRPLNRETTNWRQSALAKKRIKSRRASSDSALRNVLSRANFCSLNAIMKPKNERTCSAKWTKLNETLQKIIEEANFLVDMLRKSNTTDDIFSLLFMWLQSNAETYFIPEYSFLFLFRRVQRAEKKVEVKRNERGSREAKREMWKSTVLFFPIASYLFSLSPLPPPRSLDNASRDFWNCVKKSK